MKSMIANWMNERFGSSDESIMEMLDEPVPVHMKRWWFCLGGMPAYLFMIQIVTGILLAFYYKPTVGSAYESVHYITEQVAYGSFIRNLHKWAATFMIASVILHQMRVFFTGAYRKPRELNWIVGMCLLSVTLLLGFTGYSLVFEQLSFWGVTVGANIAESSPLIGSFVKTVMLAGTEYNENTLSRFFILHAAILPVTLCLLIAIHVLMIRLQGISELRFEDEKEDSPKTFSFLPDHLLTELLVGTGVLFVLTVLATVFPAHLGPKADPLVTPAVIKPEWFFYTMFRWLKLFSITTAVLSTGFVIFLMFIWPFVDAWIRKTTRFKEASVWIGALVAVGIIVLTIWEAVVEH
jgi:quinol-cytochrome oxidoreductase complex cytochrome b subunit